MTDERPPTYEELTEAYAGVIADNDRLRSTIRTLQSEIIRKDAEIARAQRPKPAPRQLDPAAKDSFARPFRGR